jgi:hypothetical protein
MSAPERVSRAKVLGLRLNQATPGSTDAVRVLAVGGTTDVEMMAVMEVISTVMVSFD